MGAVRQAVRRTSRPVRRVVGHLRWRVRRTSADILDLLRRGDRTVIATPGGMRLGNWLYLWLTAHQRTSEGTPTLVLEVPGMAPWIEKFPALGALTVRKDELRFHDRREWRGGAALQRFGVDFTLETLQRFVRETLAPGIPTTEPASVVINIRRGDYYAYDGFRAVYGMDIEGYVRAALAEAGRASDILVVSDDPEWCRVNLDAILRADGREVSYAQRDPIENFLAIASARKLIGTNSTFSYWGGYVADALHADARVVMPTFHARIAAGWDAYQLDPRWIALDGFDGRGEPARTATDEAGGAG
jgi:Glycosyl transferase family 11